jgi:small-conductance mechanosensitive channel
LWQGAHSEKVKAQVSQLTLQLNASKSQAEALNNALQQSKAASERALEVTQLATATADAANVQAGHLKDERDAFEKQLVAVKGGCNLSDADVRGLRSIGSTTGGRAGSK